MQDTPWTFKAHYWLYWHMRHLHKTCKNIDRWRLGYALVYFLFPSSFTAVIMSVLRHCYVARWTSSFPVYKTVCFAVISWLVVVGLLSFFRALLLPCFLRKLWILIDPPVGQIRILLVNFLFSAFIDCFHRCVCYIIDQLEILQSVFAC